MPAPTLIPGCINPVSLGSTAISSYVSPNTGPYMYLTKIFAVGYVSLGVRGDSTTFGVFRSTDVGTTWAQVGGTKSTASLSTLDSDPDVRGFTIAQGRITGRYLYALYLVGNPPTMRVSRFDCSTESWIADSDGPLYQINDNNNAGYFIAQSDADDTLWVIANQATNGSGIRRVQRMSLPAPFGTAWTTPVDIETIVSPPNQFALACVPGWAGAVHGIFVDSEGFLVRIARISAGDAPVSVYSSPGGNVQPNVAVAKRTLGSDAQIMFAITDQGVTYLKIGYIVGFSVAEGFTYTDLGVDEFSGGQAQVFRDGSDFVFYRRLGIESLKSARWSGNPGSFGPDSDMATIFSCSGGGSTPSGIAVTYSVGTISGDNLDTWFAFVADASDCCGCGPNGNYYESTG